MGRVGPTRAIFLFCAVVVAQRFSLQAIGVGTRQEYAAIVHSDPQPPKGASRWPSAHEALSRIYPKPCQVQNRLLG